MQKNDYSDVGLSFYSSSVNEPDYSSILMEAQHEYKLNYGKSKADPIWKKTIEDLWDDCLRLLYPNADSIFDFSYAPEFLNKELTEIDPNPENGPDRRFVDSLMKVRMKTGQYVWVLVHLEIQGYNDPEFPEIMFQRYYRIRDRYKQPVATMVILTHENVTIPDYYKHSFLGTTISYEYNSYHICRQDEKELEASDNPFAQVVLIAKKEAGKLTDELLKEQKITLFRNLLKKNFSSKKISRVFSFLRNHVHFVTKEMSASFDNEIKFLTKKEKTMTLEEFDKEVQRELYYKYGKEDGVEENNKRTITNMHSKLGLTEEQIADTLELDIKFVREILNAIN